VTPFYRNSLDLPDDVFLARARAMCKEKAAFVSRAEANSMMKRHHMDGTVYSCPFCDYFHITTKDRRQCRAFTRRLSRLLREADPP
jgi:hypothetical protein